MSCMRSMSLIISHVIRWCMMILPRSPLPLSLFQGHSLLWCSACVKEEPSGNQSRLRSPRATLIGSPVSGWDILPFPDTLRKTLSGQPGVRGGSLYCTIYCRQGLGSCVVKMDLVGDRCGFEREIGNEWTRHYLILKKCIASQCLWV